MEFEEITKWFFGTELIQTENHGSLFRADETVRLINKFEELFKLKNEEIEKLKLELQNKDEFYTQQFDKISQDFKDIETRLRGHLSAETKLRSKLQKEKTIYLNLKNSEDLEKAINQSEIVKQKLNYHFANLEGGFNVPKNMPFMSEFLKDVKKLCDINTEILQSK